MMSGKLREHCENENEEMTAENSVCGNRKLLVSVRSLQSVIIVIQKRKKETRDYQYGIRISTTSQHNKFIFISRVSHDEVLEVTTEPRICLAEVFTESD